jgi:hypothetical protein
MPVFFTFRWFERKAMTHAFIKLTGEGIDFSGELAEIPRVGDSIKFYRRGSSNPTFGTVSGVTWEFSQKNTFGMTMIQAFISVDEAGYLKKIKFNQADSPWRMVRQMRGALRVTRKLR